MPGREAAEDAGLHRFAAGKAQVRFEAGEGIRREGGAGLDGEALRLLERNPDLAAVEVDLAPVVRRKRDLLRACAFTEALLGAELEATDDGGDRVFVKYARLSLASATVSP